MLTANELKKQISPILSKGMRDLGFKGSGFNYLMESEDFFFAVGIQASRYGGQCCAEFGIHPKEIQSIGPYAIDFKKLKYSDCEFRTRVSNGLEGDKWWEYSDEYEENVAIAEDILAIIKKDVLPIIHRFKIPPYVLSTIEVTDFTNLYQSMKNKLGMHVMTSDVRFAWALTKVLEQRDLKKAVEFAQYGMSKLSANDSFIGRSDLETILKKNSPA